MMVCVARIESRSTEALVRQERGLLDFFFPLPEITSTKRPVPEYAPSYPSSSKPLQPPRPMPPTKYPQSMEKPYPNQSYLTEARPPYVSKPAEPYTAPVPYKPSGPFNNYQAQNNYNNSYYPEEKPKSCLSKGWNSVKRHRPRRKTSSWWNIRRIITIADCCKSKICQCGSCLK